MKISDKYLKEIKEKMSQKRIGQYGEREIRILFVPILAIVIILLYIANLILWGLDAANQSFLGYLIGTIFFELLIFGTITLFWRFYEIPEEIYVEDQEKNRRQGC
jgi:SNF family Na+-dependent transporter